MPFIKLDCAILNSTLWYERDAREVFITALLMAEPCELTEPTPQIEVNSLALTGWEVPPGWYGLVPAAGPGIIARAQVELEPGLRALEMLGSPEVHSRSQEYDGRRLVRIDGGYIALGYMKHRDRDYGSAERMRRFRQRKKDRYGAPASRSYVTRRNADSRSIYIREREDSLSCASEFDQFWSAYPRKRAKGDAKKAWGQTKKGRPPLDVLLAKLQVLKMGHEWTREGGQYVPYPATWLRREGWSDEALAAPVEEDLTYDQLRDRMEQKRWR